MIIAIAYIANKKTLTLAFNVGQMPRTGEFIILGLLCKIVRVTHRFHKQDVPNALENQKYFADIASLDIELEKV